MAKKIEPWQIQRAEELAAVGISKLKISEAVGLSYDTVKRNKLITAAIKKGREQASERIASALMSRAEVDSSGTAAIFMAKKLRIFDDPFPTATPKTATEAKDRLGEIYEAVAKGDLDPERGDYLARMVERVVKVIETADLERRLDEIEAHLERCSDGD